MDFSKLEKAVESYDLSRLLIRDIGIIATAVTKKTGIEYIRMDMGVPGLNTPQIGINAQIAALKREGGSQYTPFDGISELKEAGAEFVQKFTGVDIEDKQIIPIVGAMHGGRVAQNIAGRMHNGRNAILFIAPGFSVNMQQARELGLPLSYVDSNRSSVELLQEIEDEFKTDQYAAVMWSSPCNPTWQMKTPWELEKLAGLLEKYAVVGIEDLAYFGFDSRHPEFLDSQSEVRIPSILQYTGMALSLFSASKIYSYARERAGFAVIGHELTTIGTEGLKTNFGAKTFTGAFVRSGLYSSVASAPGSSQNGFAAMLCATIDGELDLMEHLKPYAQRAGAMKKLFTEHSFNIPYVDDGYGIIGDGFYFTAAHSGYDSGSKLLGAMMKCGLTAVPLKGFGGEHHEGVRICTSLVPMEEMEALAERLKHFESNYGKKQG